MEFILQKVSPEANFSVESFFFFLFVMMLISFVAFLLMDMLPSMKNDHDLIDNKMEDTLDEDEAQKCMPMAGKELFKNDTNQKGTERGC